MKVVSCQLSNACPSEARRVGGSIVSRGCRDSTEGSLTIGRVEVVRFSSLIQTYHVISANLYTRAKAALAHAFAPMSAVPVVA